MCIATVSGTALSHCTVSYSVRYSTESCALSVTVPDKALSHVHCQLQCPIKHWVIFAVGYSVRYSTEPCALSVTVSDKALSHVHCQLQYPIKHWVMCTASCSVRYSTELFFIQPPATCLPLFIYAISFTQPELFSCLLYCAIIHSVHFAWYSFTQPTQCASYKYI